jgi:CheY-like chemotaxis protein
VTAVENGKAVLAALAEESFDLVLMDIQMPEMDGVEATRPIRGSRSGRFDPNLPIIAMTAYAMEGDRERFLKAGMDAFVSKPLEMKELFRVMGRVVRSPCGKMDK